MGASEAKQMHELFEEFYNSQDLESLVSLYEDDAVLLAAAGSPVQGKDAIRGALLAFLDMKGKIEFVAHVDPIVNGPLALTHGRWRLTFEGSDPVEAETAEVVRLDEDGEWRYVLDNPWGSSILES